MPGILIISPMFAPQRGGLPDHTEGLARSLADRWPTTLLTSKGADAAARSFKVAGSVEDWQDDQGLVAKVRELHTTGPIIWQYVPHMYGRGGVNLRLSKAMAELRRSGYRQLVIAHEVAAPLSPLPHRLLYALAHRRQWRAICRQADVVGISSEAVRQVWCPPGLKDCPRNLVLASPSNIPVVRIEANSRQQLLMDSGWPADTILLCYFGTADVSRRFAWVLEAWRKARRIDPRVALAVIGDNPAIGPPHASGFRGLGFVSREEASGWLQGTDLLLLPFVDGVSEKRTTFMAGLGHGCPILTTRGHNTGPTLRQAKFFASVEATDREGFSEAVVGLLAKNSDRERLRTLAKGAYAQAYDWPVLVGHIADELALAK